jgi:acyl dehydratase
VLPSLLDLPAGHPFEPVTFVVTAARARAYREAVGDRLSVYDEVGGAVPPLAVVALALGALLEKVQLPPGSLHASESVRFHGVVPAGAAVDCRARIAQRSLRAGWAVSVLETDLYVDGREVASARATVMSPPS